MTRGVKSVVDSGMGATIVDVECHLSNGLPSIVIIGYASKAVDEARDRLRASFSNCSLNLPKKRITINLAPADIPKDSTSLDLAMAIAMLVESRQIEASKIDGCAFLGEVGLDGKLNPVRGVVGRILKAKDSGIKTFYIPASNQHQALLIPNISVKAAESLRDVYLDLNGSLPIKALKSGGGLVIEQSGPKDAIDFSEISGQPIAKRAITIAAAGHHNILLHGPPGTGKTMLAKAMCGILPPLERSEVLEVTQLNSLSEGDFSQIITNRPFRSPHHTASTTALVGGGTNPRPGEASLAHRGVLFLDELPEFSHGALEALRQPLEDGTVTIARVKSTLTYPAQFILVATQNPCPCGFFGTPKPCSCSPSDIARYQKKVSGPILDRIDLHLPVLDIDHSKLLDGKRTDESPKMRRTITEAYERQKQRFGEPRFNSSMSNKEVREKANLSAPAKELLDKAASKLGISARAYVRTVKVARTIADLAGEKDISPTHIAEALQYRHQPLIS